MSCLCSQDKLTLRRRDRSSGEDSGAALSGGHRKQTVAAEFQVFCAQAQENVMRRVRIARTRSGIWCVGRPWASSKLTGFASHFKGQSGQAMPLCECSCKTQRPSRSGAASLGTLCMELPTMSIAQIIAIATVDIGSAVQKCATS